MPLYWLITLADPERPEPVHIQLDVADPREPEAALVKYVEGLGAPNMKGFVERWRKEGHVALAAHLADELQGDVQLINVSRHYKVDERTLLPATNEITRFLHCAKCIREVKIMATKHGRASPEKYARLSVGFTPRGLQVWCVRHDVNICHIDFEGQQHPANTDRAPTKRETN